MKIATKGDKPLLVALFSFPCSGNTIITQFFNSIERCLFIAEMFRGGHRAITLESTRYGEIRLEDDWELKDYGALAKSLSLAMYGFSDVWAPYPEVEKLWRANLAASIDLAYSIFMILRHPLKVLAALRAKGNLEISDAEFSDSYVWMVKHAGKKIKPFFYDRFIANPLAYASKMLGLTISGKIELVVGENFRGDGLALQSKSIAKKDERQPIPLTDELRPSVEAYEKLRGV